MTDNSLTLTEAAARIGVHRRTLRAWIRAGRLEASRTPGGHWRVRESALAQLPMTTLEFAHAVGVCQRTALRWCEAGKLEAEHEPNGPWRIAAKEVERIGPRVLKTNKVVG